MMPILVKSDDVRSGRKAKAHHRRLRPSRESMGLSNLLKVTLLKCLPRCFCPDSNTVYSVFLGLLINSNF